MHIAPCLVVLLCLVLVGATLFKNAQVSDVLNSIGMKFGTLVLQVSVLRLAESDFLNDIILSSWRS